MFCQKCGAEYKDGAAFCNSCGADLRIAPVTPADPLMTGACKSCGEPIKLGEKLCGKCLAIKLEGMKVVSSMTPKKQRIESLRSKIAATKKEIEQSGQTGPIVLAVIGALLLIVGVGLIIIIIAIIWAYLRDKEQKRLKELLFQYEGELYNIEKEP